MAEGTAASRTDGPEWWRVCRTFAREVMEPQARALDEAAEFPFAVHERAAAEGLLTAPFPEEVGGAGLTSEEFTDGVGELAAVCAPMTWTMVFNRGALHPVLDAGTPEQKELFVTGLLRRGGYAALALTEPDKGSNLLAARTRAVRTDSGWLLNGAKCMTGNGTVAEVFMVLVDTVVNSRRRGLSLFAVPRDAPGVTVGENITKAAFRCLPTPPVAFRDVPLEPVSLIGGVGDGEHLLGRLLATIRLGGAACGTGLVTALLRDAVKWVGERRVYPDERMDTLSHVQLTLGRLHVELSAARALLRDAARLADRGLPFARESAMAKYYATDLAVRASNEILQLYGWRGIAADHGVEKRWRDARALTIYEGSSEVQLLTVFRELRRGVVSGEGV
ncbi:acyl-CoA dehydrogenase family protein [Streptomyces sp. NPDC004610]|uniref:acyl-CoA dehydrogenase family protein n=1 Tax=unclassified Streptomyces TaxID=2593676 RepID=UPI0033B5674E